MGKTYQPFIIEKAEQIMKTFIEPNIIEHPDAVKKRICDFLTEKFIVGELSSEDSVEDIFTLEEFFDLMLQSAMQDDLSHLIDLGLIGIYEDDGEEIYFLTEEGKKYARNNGLIR